MVPPLPAVSARAPAPARITPPPIVLLDDDTLVHATWRLAADRTAAELLSFWRGDDLLVAARELPKSARFFLDAHLGDGASGIEVALELFQRGFQELFIQTGSPHSFGHRPFFVREVVSKSPTAFTRLA